LKYLPISYWIILPLQIITGVLVFFLVNERIRLPEYIEVKEMACGYLKAVLKK
jgi:hypothetical protein